MSIERTHLKSAIGRDRNSKKTEKEEVTEVTLAPPAEEPKAEVVPPTEEAPTEEEKPEAGA